MTGRPTVASWRGTPTTTLRSPRPTRSSNDPPAASTARLRIHYLADPPRFLGVVADALGQAGGSSSPSSTRSPPAPSHPAFIDGPGGGRVWPLDGDLEEGPYTMDWLAPGVVIVPVWRPIDAPSSRTVVIGTEDRWPR